MTNANLTDEQKNNYIAVNAKFGMSDLESTYNPADHAGKALTFSADPVQSDVPPRLISVNSIAEMKNLVGNPADRDDSNIEYPEAYPAEKNAILETASTKMDLIRQIDEGVKANLIKAARAYVLGNPNKVKGYEPLINAVMFPMYVAYFAAATPYLIDAPVTVTGPNPIVWNHPAIVFKSGGAITADVDFTINCTTMLKES